MCRQEFKMRILFKYTWKMQVAWVCCIWAMRRKANDGYPMFWENWLWRIDK